MKIILFFFTLLFLTKIEAQVIDIEHLRLESDSVGFAGSIGLNFKLVKNTREIFALGSSGYIQYRQNEHLVFLINNIAYQKIDDQANINYGTLHLRYNYTWRPKIILEAFGQSQYNSIAKIDQRQLIGGGPRFVLKEEDRLKAFLGTIFMYEHEKVSDDNGPIYNDDYRFSFYFALRYLITENIALSTTTFYQPLIEQWSDFRIYSTNSVSIKIIEKLTFNVNYIYDYDANPAVGIPKTQYQLTNGINYTFD